MKRWAYYNEVDRGAAAWIRELIKEGHVAPGEVDERSIEDVLPSDVAGFAQCHYFAGIAVWSHALRKAGWPDDREVWTGSAPCQPFSSAGKAGGFGDERHLWPAFFHLIHECRPPVVLGEQVASKDGLAWLDLVQSDLEGADYASRAVDLCSAGFGAPHIRQRLYWVAKGLDDTAGPRHQRSIEEPEGEARLDARLRLSGSGGGHGLLANTDSRERGRFANGQGRLIVGASSGRQQGNGFSESRGHHDVLAHTDQGGLDRRQERDGEPLHGQSLQHGDDAGGRGGLHVVDHAQGLGREGRQSLPFGSSERHLYAGTGADDGMGHSERQGLALGERLGGVPGGQGGTGQGEAAVGTGVHVGGMGHNRRPGPTNGFWADPDWLFCRDGKWRPARSGSQPLASGSPARVGRLRGYGNGLTAQVAQGFIEAVMECLA